MKSLSFFFMGVLFSVGLVVGGMTQPAKVVNFLDFFGDWDPSLAFVMAGAILVHAPVYLWIKKRLNRPLVDSTFFIPTRHDLDFRLAGGAALFGVGWGLGGYCPGPALVSLSSLSKSSFVFVLSMIIGMVLFRPLDQWLSGLSTKRAATPRPHELEARGG